MNNKFVLLKDLDINIRQEMSEIYQDNVNKIRQTMAIANKYFKNGIDSGEIVCYECGLPIRNGFSLHAIVHCKTSNPEYWKKDNLKPIHKGCHDSIDIEQYLLDSGEIIAFKKSQQELPYRQYLKDPELK